MYQPTFSIIIGAYNHAKTIGKLAEAINRQSITDFEIHLCDDGSTDDTREVFEEALHPIFKHKYHYHYQKNRGMRLSKNVNNGINSAKGKYCVFIMGDSFPENDYLTSFRPWLAENRILCGVRYHVDNGVAVDIDWRLKKMNIPPHNVLLPSKPFNNITGNGLVIPTQAMREHGGWDENIKGYGGDDQEIVARLFYKGYMVYSIVDAKLYHHWHKATPNKDGNFDYVKKQIEKYAS